VRPKQRRKIARRQRGRMATATGPNQCWSMDFMNDKLADGRSFRILTVVDQFTRECVCWKPMARDDRNESGSGGAKSKGGTGEPAG
jgi:transposase InsO family protein